MTPRQKKKVTAICTEKARTDDALGRFSDHEGEDIGPTWHLFSKLNYHRYADHVEYEIGLHKQQIRTMRTLLRLKRRTNP